MDKDKDSVFDSLLCFSLEENEEELWGEEEARSAFEKCSSKTDSRSL